MRTAFRVGTRKAVRIELATSYGAVLLPGGAPTTSNPPNSRPDAPLLSKIVFAGASATRPDDFALGRTGWAGATI